MESNIVFETLSVIGRGRHETFSKGCLNLGRKGLTRVEKIKSRFWHLLYFAHQLSRFSKTINLIGQPFKHDKFDCVILSVFDRYFPKFERDDLIPAFSIDYLCIS